MSQQTEFINTIAPLIVKEAKSRGYKVASAIIAQACLESNYGKSTLSAKYHNYFGMKCGSYWTGKSVNMTTKEEYKVGTLTTIRIISELMITWSMVSRVILILYRLLGMQD